MEQSNADARDDGTARPHQPGDVLPSSTQSATSQRRSARKATLATTEHVCFECGLPFTSSNSLTVHLRLHSGDQPYQCTACGKRFLHKSQLMVHERSHSGETPFACPVRPNCCKLSVSFVVFLRFHQHNELYLKYLLIPHFANLARSSVRKRSATARASSRTLRRTPASSRTSASAARRASRASET